MFRDCGTTNKMLITLISFLVLLCNGLCSDPEQEKRVLEEEVLRNLLTSKLKPNKHIAPLWQLPLRDVCRMLGHLRDAWQKSWSSEEEEETEDQAGSSFIRMLVGLHDLQNLCRVLQARGLQDGPEYQDPDQNSDAPLKRKSPYILKRQLRTNKWRRPYILRRNAYF